MRETGITCEKSTSGDSIQENTSVYKSIQEYTKIHRGYVKHRTSSENLVTSGSCSVRTKLTISSVVYSPENTARPLSNWERGRGREEGKEGERRGGEGRREERRGRKERGEEGKEGERRGGGEREKERKEV